MPSFTTATDNLFSLFSYHFTDPNDLFDSNPNPEDGGTRNFWELRNTYWKVLYQNHKDDINFSPKYDPFYEWYFQWIWTPIYNYTTVGPFSISRKINYTTHETSPFPIPPNYTKMFAWIDEKDAFKFTDIYCPPLPDNFSYDPNIPYYMYNTNDRKLMESYFDVWFDPDPKYEEFYKWYYVQLHRAKDPFAPTFPAKRIPKAREEVPSISTPFPIPVSFRRYYAWAHDDSYNVNRTTVVDTTHRWYRTLVSLYGFPTGHADPYAIQLPYSHELTTRPPRNESAGFKENFFESYPDNLDLDNDRSIPFEWFREGRDWPYDEWGESTFKKYNNSRARKKRHTDYLVPSNLLENQSRCKRELPSTHHHSSASTTSEKSSQILPHRPTTNSVLGYYKSLRDTFGKAPFCNTSEERRQVEQERQEFREWLELNEKMRRPPTPIQENPTYSLFFHWLHKGSPTSPKYKITRPLINTPFPVPEGYRKQYAERIGAEHDEVYKDLRELGIIDEIPPPTIMTTVDDFFVLPNTTPDDYSDDTVQTSPRTRPTQDDMGGIEFVRSTDKLHFDSKEMYDRMNDLGLVDAKLDEKRTIFPTIPKFVTRQPFDFEALLKKESQPTDGETFTRQAFDFDVLIKRQSNSISSSSPKTHTSSPPTNATIDQHVTSIQSVKTEYQRSTFTLLAGLRDYYKSLRETFGKAPIISNSEEKRQVEAERAEFRKQLEENRKHQEQRKHPLEYDVSPEMINGSMKIPSEYLRAYLQYTGAQDNEIRQQLKDLGYRNETTTSASLKTKATTDAWSSNENSDYSYDTPEALPIMNLDVVEEPADARHMEIDSQPEKVNFNSREALERLRCMGMLAGMTTRTTKKYPHDIFSKQFVIEPEAKEFLDLGPVNQPKSVKRVRRAVEIILLSYESTTKRTTTRRPSNNTNKYFTKRQSKSTTIDTYDFMVSDIRFKAKHIEEYENHLKKLGIYFMTTIEPYYAEFFQWYYRRIREVCFPVCFILITLKKS